MKTRGLLEGTSRQHLETIAEEPEGDGRYSVSTETFFGQMIQSTVSRNDEAEREDKVHRAIDPRRPSSENEAIVHTSPSILRTSRG